MLNIPAYINVLIIPNEFNFLMFPIIHQYNLVIFIPVKKRPTVHCFCKGMFPANHKYLLPNQVIIPFALEAASAALH